MKRWIAAMLIALLLAQALPLEALAATGKVMTDAELAAAYALTGFGDSAVQRNAVYHKGMTPNATWNAMQVSDWLDEMLETCMFSVEDILSRASNKLMQLQEEDPAAFRRFTDDSPEYAGVAAYIQEMYQEAEALRQEMRFQQDRIQEQAGLIAELGRKLKEGGNSLYPSDRVRLSAQIETATAELKAARQEVADNADEWAFKIEMMQTALDAAYGGAAEGDHPAGRVGEWVEALFGYGGGAVRNSAPVTLVSASGSRLGRMASNGSVLSNADNATLHVMTENEIGLVFYASDGKGGKKYLKGVKVKVRDNRNSGAEPATYESDERGGVYIPSSKFTADNGKNVLFKLDVEAEALGYRSYGAAKVKMKLGEVRQVPMVPLSGAAGNGVVANAAEPYVYSVSFEGNDILKDDYEMMYTSMNSWDFEIRVEVRNPGGGSAPEPKLGYWAKGSSGWHYEQKWAEPTSQDGNVYIFKNKWKRILAPELKDEQRPFIAFSKDDSAERFRTHLISLKSVVDSPVEEGSDAFSDVLSEGMSFGFHIPVVDMDVALNLPFKSYLPKISVDLAGFVTLSIGSDLLQEKLDDKVNWQSADMEYLTDRQKAYEEENGFANYKAQYGVAYETYKQEGWQFYGESKMEIGLFAVLSARWEIDNEAENITQKIVKGRGSAGILVKYSYSWTIMHIVGPVPVYISFTLGVSAGFAIGLQIGFSWINGKLKDWELKPLKDITVNIAFTFTAQFGVGIKGFLELWGRFTASLNFRLTLVIMGDGLSSFVISGGVSLAAGLTVFWVEISKTWGPWGGTLYDSSANSNALPPLQRYAIANAAEEITPATQEPSRYPGLVPSAKAILTNEKNARSDIRVVTSNGHTFAFYLEKIRIPETGSTLQRVCWVDVNTGKKGNVQQHLSDLTSRRSRDLHDFAFDAWSDGSTILIVGCCAGRFDENGYPVESLVTDRDNYAYCVPLTYSAREDDLLGIWDFPSREASACSLDLQYNPRGITNPHIEWAKVTYENYEIDGDRFVAGIEMYGFADRVNAGDASMAGYACFDYTNGGSFALTSDAAVMNALGSDHERVNLRSSVKGLSGRIDGTSRFRCFSFVALSRPKEGVEGESAIELFDWEMNTAPIKYTTQVKPTILCELVETKRKAVAVKKGDIGGFELVQTVGTGKDGYSQMLFYTEAETNGDGAKIYKLKGLHIGGKQGALTRSLSYDVTDYVFDVTLPTSAFKVQTVNGTPYIYWLSTVEKKAESDPDTWRLWVAMYDPATNTVSTPAVFSEFTLESGVVPRDVVLTAEGQGYLTATPMPKDGDRNPQPLTLYGFPLTLRPVLTLKGMIVEDVTVAAGDFEDTAIALMNEGNMGISAFDIEMFTREGGRINVVETLHCDCLHPENSKLTMKGASRSETLPKGKQSIYRNSDFDYTARQRDWVLGEKKLTLKAKQSSSDDAWTSSISERDAKTQFVQSNMMMPGALASFTGTLKIPENWSGDKTLYLRVSSVSSFVNWQGAMANAAGVKSDSGIVANAAATRELTWTLDEKRDKLVLQAGELASNAAFANAVSAGMIANAVEAGDAVPLNVSVHDVEVDHRLYEDCDGTEMLDIIVMNYADTKDNFRLNCQVYLDGAQEPYIVTLPYYEKATSMRAAHTITLPVSALVKDPKAHKRARVVISAIGRDELAYSNNEFTLYLGGGTALRLARQPRDVTAQTGEDVTFEVAVEGGVAPYTYQWQVWHPDKQKWVDLKGFTEASMSREAIEKAWNGARFRCVVKDAAGETIVSREVTLAVRDSVPTGDRSNLPLYLALALAALVLLGLLRRRYRADRG